MGTTADKLQKIINTKAAIKEVANQHGAEITDDTPFSEYGGKIDAVCKAAFDNGAEKEWSDFWDVFQDYGNRDVYEYLLYHHDRTDEWFYPKYDIRPRLCSYFARDAKTGGDSPSMDLVERLNECGVTLDFSNSTNVTYLFYSAQISHIPEINVTKAGNSANSLLFGTNIETIDKFIFTEEQNFTQTFGYAYSLKNIVFEGVIGRNISLKHSDKLTVESVKSLISCLKNYKGTENEYIYTVTLHENVWALLDAEGNASPDGTTWREYVQNTLGWNI